jgi:predicted transcriptional regulator
MASEQNRVITFRLSQTAAEQLEQHAKETGTSISRLLQDLVADYLDEQNPEFAEPPNPLLIRYLLHIIYELVRTRVSLFRIAEGRLVDEEGLNEIYESARETAQTYINRLDAEMIKAPPIETSEAGGDSEGD